jgi:glycosyltransferase involved in cell wall biosynthesis
MTPAVSVLMPVRDGAAHLPESIPSVQSQTFPSFEFLIVDDGSADATPAILASFAAADPRIRVFSQPQQGIVAALNAGIAQARAPYLARLDADDVARPDRLGRQVAFMAAHPDIGLLGTWAEIIDAAGTPVGRLMPPVDPARLARVLARTNPFVHSSVMMRTALVRRLGGYRTAFRAAEDYDLWLRMAEAGGVANLAENLVQYRWHTAGQSQRDAVRQAFSTRLAQRSAAARRRGAADPAAALTAPPDWWAQEVEGDAATFDADDAGLYRFLDADAQQAPHLVHAVTARLLRMNHAERRLAQARLRAMLHETPGGWRRIGIALLIAALHPGRAFRFAREAVAANGARWMG